MTASARLAAALSFVCRDLLGHCGNNCHTRCPESLKVHVVKVNSSLGQLAVLSPKHLRFVSQLYRYAPSRPLTPFREWALSRLAEIVPFDAAVWSNITVRSQYPHLTSTRGLITNPSDFHQAFQKYAPSVMATLHHPSPERSLSYCLDQSVSSVVADLWRELPQELHAPESSVAVSARSSGGAACSLIILTRSDGDFSREDAELVTQFAFYMSDASALACFLHLRQPALLDRNRRAAITSADGEVLEAQPFFVETMLDADPAWDGKTLAFVAPTTEKLTGSVGQGHSYSVEPFDGLVLVRIWPNSPLDALSEREMQCAIGICRGMSYKQIARELGISPSTVGTLIRRAMTKLNAQDRRELRQIVIEGSPDLRARVLSV
ncbi:MAG: hypothetical protein CME32_23195 [Gimesia sp.]|nr:hypothetical protein [Gimesia sp.]